MRPDPLNPTLDELLQLCRMDRTWVRGEGVCLWDREGRPFWDFYAQYGAVALGHNAPAVNAAVQQALKEAIPAMVQPYGAQYAVELARRLQRLAPGQLSRCVFTTSGAQTVETALKLVRARTGRPLVVAAQIVMGFQTIVSRSVNITEAPAVVTVGRFSGGVRANIIPETVVIEGTVRAFDENVRQDIHRRMRDIATMYAQASGAPAELELGLGYPVTRNDPALTERMLPTLRRAAGADEVREGPLTGTAEDFAYYQQKVPGLFFFLGVTPRDQDHTKAPQNHSPLFFADESALPVGVRAMSSLAVDFLRGPQP